MDNETLYWVWLSCRLGAGTRQARALLDRFGSPFEIYRYEGEGVATGNRDSLDRCSPLDDKDLSETNRIVQSCERLGVDIIPLDDGRYPARLRAIQNPPTVLYCRGLLPNFDRLLCIGVVGTRNMSEYGCRAAYKISYGLAAAGVITVSGMALGVDGVVAGASLASGGHTVAVLGCGVDTVYPPRHQKIYSELLRRGTVLSEYPPGARPTKFTFPQRNRIISGLSQGTFVVEGDFNSGALITARDALVQGRELFALPGNVGEKNSNGTNALIREGAHPVFSAADIINEFLPLYRDEVDLDRLSGSTLPEYDREVLERYGVAPDFPTTQQQPVQQTIPIKTRVPASDRKKPVPETPQSKPKAEKHDDGSREAYASLSPDLREVYDRLPSDKPAPVDRLVGKNQSIGEIIAALTLLELQGLVVSLPGGLYSRT